MINEVCNNIIVHYDPEFINYTKSDSTYNLCVKKKLD